MRLSKLLLVLAASSVVLAQPPRVINATVQSRSAAGGLDGVFRALVAAQSPDIEPMTVLNRPAMINRSGR